VEYLSIWEKIHNPNFNYGEFDLIKSQAGLNSYKISVKVQDIEDPKLWKGLSNLENLKSEGMPRGTPNESSFIQPRFIHYSFCLTV